MTDWLVPLVITVAALRGLGAGAILGILLTTLPNRGRLGTVPYARLTRELYRGPGVRVYAGLTILGTALTLVALLVALASQAPTMLTWSIGASLAASLLGFVGTARAFPTMIGLWDAPDGDESHLGTLLDRFARWASVSATGHILAFATALVALVAAAVP